MQDYSSILSKNSLRKPFNAIQLFKISIFIALSLRQTYVDRSSEYFKKFECCMYDNIKNTY